MCFQALGCGLVLLRTLLLAGDRKTNSNFGGDVGNFLDNEPEKKIQVPLRTKVHREEEGDTSS